MFNCDCPVTGLKAKNKILKIIADNGVDIKLLKESLGSVGDIIGPFDGLADCTKKKLADFALHYYEEQNYQTRKFSKFIARGFIYRFFVKIIKYGWIVRKKLFFLSRVLIFLGRRGIDSIEYIARKYNSLTYFTSLNNAPFLSIVYSYFGADKKNVIENYVKEIPSSKYTSPVFKVANKNSLCCGLIGFDFLPSNGELYFIEGNFNPGHYIDRHLLFPDGDVVCRHIVSYAKKSRLKHIVFSAGFQKYFDGKVEDAWREIATKNDVDIEIIDDAYLGSPYDRLDSSKLDYDNHETLYVTSRYFDNPLSNMVVVKGELDKNISTYNMRVDKKDRILLPEGIDKNILPESLPKKHKRFPNFIVKNKYIDRAKGIHLFKADSIPDIALNADYLVSQYVVPDTIKKEEDATVKEYVYLFRTYLLITPDGPIYVGTRKDVSGTPLPESLVEGEVTDIAPYITNITTAGDYCVAHTPEEHLLCKEATLRVGIMLHNFLKEKYDLTT